LAAQKAGKSLRWPSNVLILCVLINYNILSGLFSSIFWEQGFDKVRESSRTLELFEQFDVQL